MRHLFPIRLRALAGGLLIAAACGESNTKNAGKTFQTAAARRGLVVGRVLDADTGDPVANADVEVTTNEGPKRVPTRVDGTFEVDAPSGRARVAVMTQDFLVSAREVAVGEDSVEATYKLARRAPVQPIGSAGGTLQHQQALIAVPSGAYADGSEVSLTYLSRGKVAAVTDQAQFVDGSKVPRRAVAAVTLDGRDPPGKPVRLQVPVPADASVTSVVVFPVDPSGMRRQPIAAESVADGMAVFPITDNGSYSVAVDARVADDKKLGYLVVEGDGAMSDGQVVGGGTDVFPRRTLAVVDPQGSRIEMTAGTRVRLAVPADEVGSGGTSQLMRAPYAGTVQLSEGRARFVVSKDVVEGGQKLSRLTVSTASAAFDVTGTAFTLSSCQANGKSVDVLEVVEGRVQMTFRGNAEQVVQAGERVTLCSSCTTSAAPVCGAAADAGARADAAGSVVDGRSADAAVMVDAEVRVDVPGIMDGAVDAGLDAVDPPPAIDTATALDVATADAAAPAQLTLTPGTFNFGSIQAGTNGVFATFTIKNTGGVPSGAVLVTLTGADAVDFSIGTNSCGPALVRGATCTIDVAFTPKSAGVKQATLAAAATPGGMPAASLTGTGVTSGAVAAITPTTLDFGYRLPTYTSDAFTFNIKNIGGAATGPLSVTMSGPNTPYFTVVTNTCSGNTVAPAATCSVAMQYTPAGIGTHAASLTVSGMPGGTTVANVSGTGQATGNDLEVNSPNDFGSAVAGQPGLTRNLVLTNHGLDTQVTSIALSGPHAGDFVKVADSCTATIVNAFGGTCMFSVKFQPSKAGERWASVTVMSSASGSTTGTLFGLGL